MAHGYVETKSSSIKTTRIKWRSDLSSGTVSQEELGWMSRVVAGELKTLPEAARPYPKWGRRYSHPHSWMGSADEAGKRRWR